MRNTCCNSCREIRLVRHFRRSEAKRTMSNKELILLKINDLCCVGAHEVVFLSCDSLSSNYKGSRTCRHRAEDTVLMSCMCFRSSCEVISIMHFFSSRICHVSFYILASQK